jgi:glycosyltransferase involved in cell wall biosynthesis
VALLDRRVADWLAFASPIASSEFMADEIARFYPSAPKATIVRLAPFVSVSPVESVAARSVVAALGVEPPYVLSPTHLSVHKNLGVLIAAHELLALRFPELTLVVTGLWTDAVTGHATSIGSARDGTSPNVIGLGYVTNEQIDSLIECASVVVNASLYEAGNGSGLDAWSRGVPVAMSDIPSFTEHVRVFGVDATVFDPRSPSDIADKIGEILDHPDTWRERGRQSRKAIERLTWDGVAYGYLAVFDATLAGGTRG